MAPYGPFHPSQHVSFTGGLPFRTSGKAVFRTWGKCVVTNIDPTTISVGIHVGAWRYDCGTNVHACERVDEPNFSAEEP